MQRDPRAFLWDVLDAGAASQSFTAGLNAATYLEAEMAQSAVERKFEIIGEALNQLAKLDDAMAKRIPDLKQSVAFRNLLIHGYAAVSVSRVWSVVNDDLPQLLAAVQALSDELR